MLRGVASANVLEVGASTVTCQRGLFGCLIRLIIVPPRHGGTDDDHNLTWACYYCNHSKGTDIGTIDFETQERVWLFDPRHDNWDAHFEMLENGLIYGKTNRGRATARLLLMNTPDMVEIRRFLIEAGLW